METNTLQETSLLNRLNAGDEQAFETVFHKYYASLCFFANKFLHDTEASRDVVQEVFIRFYEKKYDFSNLIALKSFLYNCVQHKALNYLEKANNRAMIREKLEFCEYEENDYFLYQTETEMFEAIFKAIEELPAECRRIFKMSYIEHLDIKEISSRLQIAETTIKTQRARAKKFLQNRLQHLYPLAILIFI